MSVTEIGAIAAQPVDRRRFCAVVPAAGAGSRLGSDEPKVLYPLLGRPIAMWLIDALDAVCDTLVFVLSPSGAPLVEPVLRERLGDRLRVVVQHTPTGMGDAVLLAEEAAEADHTIVVWGDQATLSQRTLRAVASRHESAGAALTLPIVRKADPYIHFVRDESGAIVGVQQKREGEITVDVGDNDCGLFFFRTDALFGDLRRARAAREGMGATTTEFNLVQLIPNWDRPPFSIETVLLADPDETLGVNTPQDAAAVEAILRSRA